MTFIEDLTSEQKRLLETSRANIEYLTTYTEGTQEELEVQVQEVDRDFIVIEEGFRRFAGAREGIVSVTFLEANAHYINEQTARVYTGTNGKIIPEEERKKVFSAGYFVFK